MITPATSEKTKTLTFRSEKSTLVACVLWGTSLLLAGLVFFVLQREGWGLESLLITLFALIIAAALLWPWFNTAYKITDDSLYYKSGFFKGFIPIGSIRSIEKDKLLRSGFRPALATHGLLIHYFKGPVGEEIYISPESKEQFLKELLLRNHQIEIK